MSFLLMSVLSRLMFPNECFYLLFWAMNMFFLQTLLCCGYRCFLSELSLFSLSLSLIGQPLSRYIRGFQTAVL